MISRLRYDILFALRAAFIRVV